MARNHFYHLYYLSTRDIFISLLGSFSSVLIIFVIIGFAFAYAFEIRCSEKGYIPRMHGFAICFYVVMSLVFQWFLFWSTYSVFHIFIFSAFILMVHLLSFFHIFRFIFIYLIIDILCSLGRGWSFCTRSLFFYSKFCINR